MITMPLKDMIATHWYLSCTDADLRHHLSVRGQMVIDQMHRELETLAQWQDSAMAMSSENGALDASDDDQYDEIESRGIVLDGAVRLYQALYRHAVARIALAEEILAGR